MTPIKERTRSFINPDALRDTLADAKPAVDDVRAALLKARRLEGLTEREAAVLLNADDPMLEREILEAAGEVKQLIYGRRIVLFAPLYIGNRCSNDCLYCAFRSGNRNLARRSLDMHEIEEETRALLREGHKRILLLSGEDATEPVDRLIEAIRRIYAVSERGASIRRINVEVAPLDVDEFCALKKARIGTYACFQETYDPTLYAAQHRSGPKADYERRLFVMDRAMEGGIDDVGIGALFGLGDFRFEVLGLLSHAKHLEERFGCGPHTISVPRIEPADGAPAAANVPRPVSDAEFKRIVATLRLALPYTGIILSTRESEEMRDELFRYGVSQVSAGSRTNPGAYAGARSAETSGSQFALGDTRTLEEVVAALADSGYVPSFCTGCYRKGRVGADFMDLAKPGLIQRFCEPNALFTFAEYVADYAGSGLRAKADQLAETIIGGLPDEATRTAAVDGLARVASGERDVYL